MHIPKAKEKELKIEKEKESSDNKFVLKAKDELYIPISIIINRKKLINISLFNSNLYKQLKIPLNLYNKSKHNLLSTNSINNRNCFRIMDSLVIVSNQIDVLFFLIFS